ncbi:hypothetical protein IR196_12020 [Brucella anthropi]|uniref:hypothetical protein n=1 Tax=Brucella anthropi TaxID=529 RepID=UPI001420BA98|nr:MULTISPECIES: hypothetical protein [Brucella/Ochrobactrum group]NIH76705.1 hypothetical protein [Ochrobactrum sp. P20RRXII]QPA28956.1 hypothetical protein IR196_12020 [Brucella anthropi]
MASEMDDTLVLDEDIDPNSEQVEWEKILEELKSRCDIAKLEFSKETSENIYGFPYDYATVEIPNGKIKRKITLSKDDAVREFLKFKFENIVFLGDLEAFVDYNTGEIEAVISSHDQVPVGSSFRRLARHYGGTSSYSEDGMTNFRIEIQEREDGEGIITLLGRGSDRAATLREGFGGRFFTIKLSNCNVTTHDAALNQLQKIADALFFQIDLNTGIALRLVKSRRINSISRLRSKRKDIIPIVFPKQEYDSAPISLYWYARSAVGMPLLQYLAYYQVIEFYFPTFFQKEVARRLQALLKDPLFRADRDADITRVVSTIKSSGSGARGSERDQIKATIKECISARDLRDFIESDDDRSKFFFSKKTPLSKVRLHNNSSDLRDDISELVYEIRCKIVHTKNDEGEESTTILLPFSQEAELLKPYLELMRFLSQRILIAASTKLEL